MILQLYTIIYNTGRNYKMLNIIDKVGTTEDQMVTSTYCLNNCRYVSKN